MKKDSRDYIIDMLRYGKRALHLVETCSHAELIDDTDSKHLFHRYVEIFGQAASKIPLEEQLAYPAIPWAQIIALRNRLAHAYDFIETAVIINAIEDDMARVLDCVRIMAQDKGLDHDITSI
jgi:uncharacterized protein with HEPN domain